VEVHLIKSFANSSIIIYFVNAKFAFNFCKESYRSTKKKSAYLFGVVLKLAGEILKAGLHGGHAGEGDGGAAQTLILDRGNQA
jgi:hypothetical protein